MSKRFQFEIIREATVVETVHAIIVAKNEGMAKAIAEGMAEGVAPNWPEIERYNVADRTPVEYNPIAVTEVKENGDS